MRRISLTLLAVLAVLNLFGVNGAGAQSSSDPLASWREGPAKAAIVDFVTRVTTDGSPDFIPPADRIATFDNDGTLWTEQPMYVQLAFALDRIRELAPQHPEWRDRQPFKAAREGDLKTLAAGGERLVVELITATHAGMTTDEFAAIVRNWLASARHPRFNRPYTELVYQPMLELLSYLRANGFKTYIVSGGGVEFMRPWTERIYGIPAEQVIGSTIATEFEMRDGKPALVRLPQIDFIDDKAGKPVAINKFIGKKPVFVAGNSDGDLQMLQWATAEAGLRFGLIVHHTDAVREYAYDRDTPFGRLVTALELAEKNGWVVADMKESWREIYPPSGR